MARGKHPAPFRTRKLSLSAPMVLHGGPCGRLGRRRTTHFKGDHHSVATLEVFTPTNPSGLAELWVAPDEAEQTGLRVGIIRDRHPWTVLPRGPQELLD